MKRYTQLPLTLYRIQARLPVSLRDQATQWSLGRRSFDLVLHDGKVRALPTTTDAFTTPNGMSPRPFGPKMAEILRQFRGSPLVYRLHEGTVLLDSLCVWHVHTDQWSMQTTVETSLHDFNQELTRLLESVPPQTREELFAEMEDKDNQDN
ncbi:hypothetical protein M427DRAFT_52692 [Gonapodya prolifera JEL478]|uniref:Tse2 ADP-ribosyltransferase toxin domain-containing protein n=1 Tax=Gonapodya prolifera (strain JEL478) TaxID=1344416 RepID=A0A139AT37_GONPJ|nr:hypothetical protein M427DRAFT_52692 [Gonapodya prolifera JEL478]|eukprot:KXS19844.1 hypothetical protein M427DRAFT_52692 [Gonapodya prolifera JEL478]